MSLSPQGAQEARCAVGGMVLDDLPTPLLDDLRADPTDEDRWVRACLDMSLSTGEKTAVRWLAKRVWPYADWHGVELYSDVQRHCDAQLAQVLADASTALTVLTTGEAAA